MTLSIAMLSYYRDDETLLRKTIDAVYDWADEIVIVYGSPEDDRTKRIIKADSRKIIKFIFTDNPTNFLINKQKAIDACTKEWILQLDADEIVSPALKKEIQDTLKDPKVDGYWIPRLNFFLGKPLSKGGQYPDGVLRLYRNGTAKLALKTVHDQVTIKGETAWLTTDLHHYAWTSFQHFLQKWTVYAIQEGDDAWSRGERTGPLKALNYMVWKPVWWLIWTFGRHRGYVDGWSGFVFSLFSGLRFIPAYVRLTEIEKKIA
jgi:glycosyltransferase involved in cell wall biosynthesis